MIKRLIDNNTELYDLIADCYESDARFIADYHVMNGSSLEKCINKTVEDLYCHDASVYKLTDSGEFVGYFGEFDLGGVKSLTGFFLMPSKRTELYKNELFNTMVDHFNGNFSVAIAVKNTPALNYLKNRGCTSKRFEQFPFGLAEVLEFVKEDK